MRDPDSSRYPRAEYPEVEDMEREHGDVPIMKPVRYDAEAVDIRPESPKDMKDTKDGGNNTPVQATTETTTTNVNPTPLQPPVEAQPPANASLRPLDTTPIGAAPPAAPAPAPPAPLTPPSTLP
jgi:hypothetical protein